MSVVIDVARREWEDGYRRFQVASRDPVAADRLDAQLEVVTGELRRRIGQTFTLEELVAIYDRAESWVRDVVSEHAATPGWPRYRQVRLREPTRLMSCATAIRIATEARACVRQSTM